jgi:hypothetical protein
VGPNGAPDTRQARRHTEHGAIEALFEADRDRLRWPPAEAAQLLRGLTIACTLPALGIEEPRTPAQIVAVLLDGIRACPDRLEPTA